MAAVWEIVDFGIDYLTATATTKTSRQKLWNTGMRWMIDEHKHGNEKRIWEFKGYSGFKSGAVQVGTRDDSAIVRISGQLARQHFSEAFRIATNVSRIDQQVTVRADCAPGALIGKCYRDALRKTKSRLHGPTVSILKHSNGSATCYLGQRVSERFGRIYDKGLESGLPVMAGCVRFEGEFKGAQAMHQAKQLAASTSPGNFLVGNVHQFFKDRGCSPKWKRADTQTIVLHRMATDHQRQLEWIRAGCRPTIQRLIAAGHAAELYDYLCVDQLLAAVRSKRRIA